MLQLLMHVVTVPDPSWAKGVLIGQHVIFTQTAWQQQQQQALMWLVIRPKPVTHQWGLVTVDTCE
jgi:hypothetical protein